MHASEVSRMDDLRIRIDEVVSHLKTARARDVAADVLGVIFEVIAKEREKGHVHISFRGDGHRTFALAGDTLKAFERSEKPVGKVPVVLELSVDVERFDEAVATAKTMQDLAFRSGMRISGNS